MIPFWLGGFPAPVLEVSIVFWLCAAGAGVAYGWLFRDVKGIVSDTTESKNAESVTPDSEVTNE